LPRYKAILVIALTLTTLALAQPFTNRKGSLIPRVHAANINRSLVGNFNGWNLTQPSGVNPTITVTHGDIVSVRLTSVDVGHQFVVDVNNNGLFDCTAPAADKCSNMFSTSNPTTYTFTIDFPAGTYTYYCSLHPITMLGTFQVLPLHDVAISGITVSRNFAYAGINANPVKINVTAANIGSGPGSETFNVTALANATQIGRQLITLAAGASLVVSFSLNTTLLVRGSYTLSARASPVMGETNLSNNVLTSSIVYTVKLAGDVNGDCAVNFLDLGRIGTTFLTTIGQTSFDPQADLNNDGAVNFIDLGVVGSNFLKKCA